MNNLIFKKKVRSLNDSRYFICVAYIETEKIYLCEIYYKSS